MVTRKEAEEKYDAEDVRIDSLMTRFITSRWSTAVIVLVLILAVIGAVAISRLMLG